MNRSISRLARKFYDVAIIGGGIYGACVAREAAFRGLAAALVEQDDFGSATSSNSQRIIHGGFRYLQNGDVKRMRESIRERRILMRIAPHLVFPMPVLIPTYKHRLLGKSVIALALKANDVIGFDRNRQLEPEKRIPVGQILSKAECLRYCPGLEGSELNGAVLFFDGQVRNSERLTLSLLQSAVESGAVVANYAKVVGFVKKADGIRALCVEDRLSGEVVEIRARAFVNCSGPWTDRVVELAGMRGRRQKRRWCKAAILMTRQLVSKIAIGVLGTVRSSNSKGVGDKGHRYFFITPWRNSSLVGTFEASYDGDPDDFIVTEDEIGSLIEDVNAAYPAGHLTRADVRLVYAGLVPASEATSEPAKHYEVRDHGVEDGIKGLISITGVKYTTARGVAEKAVDLIERKLERRPVKSQTAVVPVYGGAMRSFEDFLTEALQTRPSRLSEESTRSLVRNYGSEYRSVLKHCDRDPEWCEPVTSGSPIIRAEVLHAFREEMACNLDDVIYRRTELGADGYPGDACVRSCAEIMARELKSYPELKKASLAVPA